MNKKRKIKGKRKEGQDMGTQHVQVQHCYHDFFESNRQTTYNQDCYYNTVTKISSFL